MTWKELQIAIKEARWEEVHTAVTTANLDQNTLNHCLHEICGKYQPALVQLLLERGAKVNIHDQLGVSPLHRAAAAWDVAAARLLLAAGANVHRQTHGRAHTPLHEAVQLDTDVVFHIGRAAPAAAQLEIVQLLLAAGADPNAQTQKPPPQRMSVFGRRYVPYRWRPFPYAVSRNNRPVAEMLLAAGADINLPGCMDSEETTALYAALKIKYFAEVLAEYEDLGLFEWLLGLGADPNMNAYYHPLRLAVQENDENVTRQLLAAGADPNLCFALHTAVQENNPSLAALLLAQGALPDLPDNSGARPLYYAVAEAELVKLLLGHGADGRAPLSHCYHPTPLSLLELAHQKRPSAEWLAELTALVLAQESDVAAIAGHELLQAAQGQSARPLADWLALGADVNTRDGHGRTALHHLVCRRQWARQLAEMELLLAHGADANAADKQGHTPLHEAVRRRLGTAVNLLLANGADVNAATLFGYTPLHDAARKGSLPLLELLLAAGANPAARLTAGRLQGWTPLDVAMAYGRVRLIPHLAPISPEPVASRGQHRLQGVYRVVQAYDTWPRPEQMQATTQTCPDCGEPTLTNTGYTAEGSGYDAERIELFQCSNCRAKWWQTMSARTFHPWSELGHFIDPHFPRDPFPGDFAR